MTNKMHQDLFYGVKDVDPTLFH